MTDEYDVETKNKEFMSRKFSAVSGMVSNPLIHNERVEVSGGAVKDYGESASTYSMRKQKMK